MVAVIFRFDLKVRSKKVKKVKKGQKRSKKVSIFKIQNFENKTHFSDSVSSQESNGAIRFCVRCL